MENWKDIPGYENCYQASTAGHIKSLSRKVNSGNGARRIIPDRIIKVQKNHEGYRVVKFSTGNEPKYLRVCRLVALTHIPNPYNLPVVNHLNGIKDDDRVENLEWTSVSGNNKHAFQIGLSDIHGENHPGCKLSNKDVELIKSMKGKMKQGLIAKQFNVSESTVSMILKGKRWQHLETNEHAQINN